MLQFGNLRFEGVSSHDRARNEKRQVNIGDSAELLAIDLLYREMGITPIEIGSEIYQTFGQDEDYVVLPLNFPVRPDFNEAALLRFPEKIIPVYLGLCLMTLNVTQEQLDYLKRFEPIGCRDERTMNFLRAHGITAYVFGCIVGTYPKTEVPAAERDTVFFVDVPSGVLPFIPKHLCGKTEFLDHEFYESLDAWGNDSGKARAAQVIERYRQDARLIVTSRFHAAVLGLALGIPTIVVLENNFFKWSWVSKYLPVYTPDKFSQIDWNPQSVDFESVKAQMLAVARKQIKKAYEKYNDIYSLSSLQENPMRSDQQNLLYCSDALKEIDRMWRETPVKEFIIWGVTENADRICDYLSKVYPDTKLVRVYDIMRSVEFRGLQTVSPSEEVCFEDRNTFTIVTSNSAKGMAEEIFKRIGKKTDNYVLCELSFLRPEDIRSKTESGTERQI